MGEKEREKGGRREVRRKGCRIGGALQYALRRTTSHHASFAPARSRNARMAMAIALAIKVRTIPAVTY